MSDAFEERKKETASHVIERYSLTYPCGCGYFIDSVSDGNFFCEVHTEGVHVAFSIIKKEDKKK